ncbi:MAG: carboxypeptidase regulatory-like domain-containing protein [Terriglobia bacterium]
MPQSRGTADLAGTVLNANGEPLSEATAIVLNIGARTRLETVTGARGEFSFPRLAPGTYRFSLRRDGSSWIARKEIAVKPGMRIRISAVVSRSGEVQLSWSDANRPGSAKASIQSGQSGQFGAAPAETSSGGEKLVGKEVSRLPLNGRDFGQLLLLAAGTQTDTNGAANFTQQYAVNGQRGSTAVFAMDGIDVTDPELGGATFDNFNVDAIQEIKSDSGVMAAAIGEGAASFTNVVTKSGTSQEHGDVFDFLRNSGLDARNFFDRRSPLNPGRLPHFERNEFGLTNGGPVEFPGIYNGRNRTYYFLEYQGFRQILGTTQVLSVPTPAERLGVDTTAFSGDTLTVPVSPAIAPLLARYPLPNDPGGPYGARTFATSSAVTTNSNQLSIRMDHRVSDRAKLFARFTYDDVTGPTTNPSQTAIDPSFAIRFFEHERNVGISYTRNLSPSFTSASSVGFIRATPLFPTINRTQPGLTFGDGLYEPFNAAAGTVTGSYGNLFQFRQSWINVRGKHALGWGVEVRLNRDTTVYGISPNGAYTFGGGAAYSPVEIVSASGRHNVRPGDPLPDSLTGLLTATPFSYTSAVAYPIFPQGARIGEGSVHRDAYNVYFQDAWKLRRNLTLNYGVRYEVGSPIRVGHHATSQPVFLNAGGQFASAWQQGVHEEMLFNVRPPARYSTDWGGLAPRLTVSWHAAKQTVFTAGGAITTILPNLWNDNFVGGGFPISVSPEITAAPGAPVPFVNGPIPITLPTLYTSAGTPVFASGNPADVPPNTVMDVQRFENGVAAQTPGGAVQPLSISGMSRDFTNGYIETYTAGVEQNFHDVSFSIEYVGTEGVGLASVVFPNGYAGASPQFAPFTVFNAAGQVAGGYGPESIMSNRSHSTYSALQASASKTSPRWGLGFQLSYTYSKAIDDTSSVLGGYSGPAQGTILQAFAQNPRDLGAERGPSTFDLTHTLSFSAIQNLGLDRVNFLRRSLGRKITSGWEFLNLSSISTGPPFSVFSGIQQTGAGSTGADRPDQIGAPALSTSRRIKEDYFGLGALNSSLFLIPIGVAGGTGPNSGVFGSLGRDTFRGPGFADFDAALIKDIAFGRRNGAEAVTLEFRSEFFNVFNLTNFGLPANVVRGSGFGLINHTAGTSRQLQFSLKLIY